MNIYVGNLSPQTTADDIRALFGRYGQVNAVNMVTGQDPALRPRCCFVRMLGGGATEAIVALNLMLVGSAKISVMEAKPRQVFQRG